MNNSQISGSNKVADSISTIGRSVSANPISNFERIANGYVCEGWAFDPDLPSSPISIHFYLDAPAGPGRIPIGSVQTNVYRPDVNNHPSYLSYKLTGNHGFRYQVPAQYITNGNYTIYAYAINEPIPGFNPLIGALNYTSKITIQYSSPMPGVDNNLISLDVYNSRQYTGNRPVIIWVHGGAWSGGDKANQLNNKLNLFNSLNYILVSVNYRLSPYFKYPEHNRDVANAIKWVYDNIIFYGGDKNKIALMGHSAGAHLVALTAVGSRFLPNRGILPTALRGVICIDGEGYDLFDLSINGGPQQKQNILNAFGSDVNLLKEASPYYNIRSSYSPFFIAKRGTAERIASANKFINALWTTGTYVKDIEVNMYTHEGVNDAIGAPGETYITTPLVAFLNQRFSY